MPSLGSDVSHLHHLLKLLKGVQDQLARGPRQIQLRKKKIAEAEASILAKEDNLKEARSTTDRKNLDLRSKETHLQDLQGKLNTAASNREYDIIRGQMEADRAAKAVLEDEIIEWLDRVDAALKEVEADKAALQQAIVEASQYAEDFEKKSVGLHQQEADLKAKVTLAEKVIPTEIRPQYKRLVETYGDEALASAENGTCNQCYVSLTQQARVILRGGNLMFCSVCGRLLYFEKSGS